ncbi:MAG: LptF/LptG family permease, partial [Desulfobulbaceae bacterium]|nr:LptF/LptG family permease [Desulfobulbaceae bacterium]
MKLLDRYLLGQFFRNVLLILTSLIAVYLLIDFFERMDNFMEAGKPLGLAVRYFLCKIPQIYDMMIPVCLLLAGVTTLGILNRQHEFVALKAAGISVGRITAPLLFGAGLVIAVNLAVGQWVLPPANSAVNRIFYEEVLNRIPTGIVRNNRIYHHAPDGIYSFRRPNPQKARFRDFSYATWDKEYRMTMLVTAATADWADGRWTLQNGQIKKRTGTHDFAIELFKRKELTLPESPDTFFVPSYKAEEYSISELFRRAKELEEDGERTG